MKVMFMAIVMVVVGLGYLAKYGKFADDALPVTSGVVRGAVAVAPAMEKQPSQAKSATGSASSAQLDIVKQAIKMGEIKPYATPELRRLLWAAEEVIENHEYGNELLLMCDFFESVYLGNTLDTVEGPKALKATALPNGVIRVTHHEGDYNGDEHSQYNHLVDFVMKGNWIDDVKSATELGVKYPTRPERSIKADAQKIINTASCDF